MKTQVARGAIYLTIASFIFLLSGYLINIWLGRQLGPEVYGAYGIVISLITVINLTQTAGLPQAVSRYISAEAEKSDAIYRTGFMTQILSTCAVSFVFFLFSRQIAMLLNDVQLTPYLQLSALIFPFYGLFALLTGYYNGQHMFRKQASLHIIYSVLKIVSIIILAVLFKLYGVIIGFILSPLIVLVLGMHLPRKTPVHFSYKKLILFSLPLVGVAIFTNLLQSIDLFFVKALLHSDKSAGFYTANQNIAEIPYYALTAVASVLFPSISKNISLNLHQETKNLIAKALRFSLFLILPGVLFICATSQQILSLLFSPAYQSGSTSLSILVIGSGFFTLLMILSTIISSAGFPHKSALLAGCGVILSSLFCLVFVPLFGLNGAAISTTIASCIVMLVASYIVYRQFRTLVPLISVGRIGIAAAFTAILAKILTVPDILLPVFYIILFGVYIVLLFVLKEIDKDDFDVVRALLPDWVIEKIKL